MKNTSSMDGGGIDVWLGTKEEKEIDAIVCTVDLMKRDSEVKILIGCTELEKDSIFNIHNGTNYMKGILIRRYGEKMRKADREIKKFEEIVDVLERCQTVRIGISGGEYPYVVPVSFGYEVSDGKLTVYFHGAKEGMKHDLIAKNNKVCVEADIFYKYAKVGRSVTTIYESLIGFGEAEIAGHDDSVKGIDLLLKHCEIDGVSAAHCVSLGITTVYKVTLSSITGKRHKLDE